MFLQPIQYKYKINYVRGTLTCSRGVVSSRIEVYILYVNRIYDTLSLDGVFVYLLLAESWVVNVSIWALVLVISFPIGFNQRQVLQQAQR